MVGVVVVVVCVCVCGGGGDRGALWRVLRKCRRGGLFKLLPFSLQMMKKLKVKEMMIQNKMRGKQ